MDIDSELHLYDHVQFAAQGSTGKTSSTNERPKNVPNTNATASKSKAKKKNWKKREWQKPQIKPAQNHKKAGKAPKNVSDELGATELLFFPKQNRASPSKRLIASPEDLNRKQNYLTKISGLSYEQQREYRAKRDARYLHKNESVSVIQRQRKKQFCLDHLVGRCNGECDRWHQMRHLRLFGACKFYISGCCANGDSCVFMHEEFPCRFYYLDLQHPKPKNKDEDKCRFKHGGPLPDRLCRYFKRQIEIWVRKLTQQKPEQFDNMLEEWMHRFDSKQMQLQQDSDDGSTAMDSNRVLPSGSPSKLSSEFDFESILSTRQINKLNEMKITSTAQLNRVPVDQLLEWGLTMDQIFEITMKTCRESYRPSDVVLDDKLSHDLDALNMVDFELDESSLYGFTEIEFKFAEGLLAMKQHVFGMDDAIIRTEMEADGTIEAEKSNATKKVCQEIEADESDDSDNESTLVINEEDV